MRNRMILAAAIVGAMLPAIGAAHAESCGLVEDPTNDTQYVNHSETAGVLPSAAVDIVSADIATDDTTLYAVIRVASLARQNPLPIAPSVDGARSYRMEFSANGRKLFVSATPGTTAPTTVNGANWMSAYQAGTVGLRSRKTTGAIDTEGNEIRIQAPLEYFAGAKLKAGDHIDGITVATLNRYVTTGQVAPGVSGDVFVSDAAKGTASYTLGDESCVDMTGDTGWSF